jgi:hypothetical protein
MTAVRTQNPYPNAPKPAGAVAVDQWFDVGGEHPLRYFECL